MLIFYYMNYTDAVRLHLEQLPSIVDINYNYFY